jgi:AmiR/NasT family two-component response regulator
MSRTAQARSGAFRQEVATGAWWWSDEVYAIHGFVPGAVVPTTELVLAHTAPEDRERVRDALAAAAAGEPGSSVHRLLDAARAERVVALTAEPGAAGTVRGQLVDLTETVRSRAQAEASAAIAASARNRACIEQAVGVVAFVEQVDAERAFDLLRVASNHANVPIRSLAQTIVQSLPELHGDCARLRGALAGLLAPASPGRTG